LLLFQVYYISGGAIKQANKMFTSIRNDYELTFNATTEVKECHDASVGNYGMEKLSEIFAKTFCEGEKF
jgi:replication factor A1